jgi:hypothetical protein
MRITAQDQGEARGAAGAPRTFVGHTAIFQIEAEPTGTQKIKEVEQSMLPQVLA